MEEHGTICPWCQTEIVWDEELGPERYCPHCDNELSGYRTVQIGIDRIGDQEEEDGEEEEDGAGRQAYAEEDNEQEHVHDDEQDDNFLPFIKRSREHLAAEEAVEKLLDQQDEVPECPSCREYMLELGKQTVDAASFEANPISELNRPLLESPFSVIRYVCPACFTMQSKLAKTDQEKLIHALTEAADRLHS